MRIGDSVWLARRKQTANVAIAEYEKPIEIKTRCNYFTVMPASSRGLAVMQYGDNVYNTWTAIANANYFMGKINEGDLMWIDGEKPNFTNEADFDFEGTANAVVKSALPVNRTISIVLESNPNKNGI